MLEGPAAPPPVRPKFLKGRAAKIWDEMVARHPGFTEFQVEVLKSYCQLAAAIEDQRDLPTARITEYRRQAELLLAPRGKVEDAEPDAAEAFFGEKGKRPG